MSRPRLAVGPGTDMFARYAHAPNRLGYCGPPEAAALRSGSEDEVRAAAVRFSGVWPYLAVLARMAGLDDPLDHRVVEPYWLGGGVGDAVDHRRFGAALLDHLGPRAGHYWSHLTPDLLDEAAPNHCFHVFGVYPWSHLIGAGADEHPLHVLDNCRIGWGTVLSRHDADADVWGRRLTLRGRVLALSPPGVTRVTVTEDGYAAVPDVVTGDVVAIHWGRVCGRLDAGQVATLEAGTARQLDVTNRRLGRR